MGHLVDYRQKHYEIPPSSKKIYIVVHSHLKPYEYIYFYTFIVLHDIKINK
jgi:hypothetical protein